MDTFNYSTLFPTSWKFYLQDSLIAWIERIVTILVNLYLEKVIANGVRERR